MRAVDLYSGIGGWALGLSAAGIDVASSYELSDAAIRTAKWNLGTTVIKKDVTRIKPWDLPRKIDAVVGSPPCTEFSWSNRGGNGDINEGLRHVRAFFRLVEAVDPEFWVLENVPRLKQIVESESKRGRSLYRFRGLLENARAEVIDISEYGLPQRRIRCLVGNIPFELLFEYAKRCPRRTLGDVVGRLNGHEVRDINFGGIRISSEILTDHEKENPLDWEEARINRESKKYHTIYNTMQFPDRLDRPVRTITATCTRVSRESIVIKDGAALRRLTLRERATLQGFPVTYRLYGGSYGEKLKLVGNALPPPLSYYVGLSIRGVSPGRAVPLFLSKRHAPSSERPICVTQTYRNIKRYPQKRRFRFSVPHLHFKSGTRFDLTNDRLLSAVSWRVEFVFGPAADFRKVSLNSRLYDRLKAECQLREYLSLVRPTLNELDAYLRGLEFDAIQQCWINKIRSESHPFFVSNRLGRLSKRLAKYLTKKHTPVAERLVYEIANGAKAGNDPVGKRKLKKYAPAILAGFIVGSRFNMVARRKYR